MRWFFISGKHINLAQVQLFQWQNGRLWLWFHGDETATDYRDPSAEYYLKLCRLLGVAPSEEVISWKRATLQTTEC